MLGHASAELTLRTYSHLMPSNDDDLDFLSKSRPDQNRTKPDQGTPKATSALAVNGRERLRFSGARDQIRTGDPHVGKEMLELISLRNFAGSGHIDTYRSIVGEGECVEERDGHFGDADHPWGVSI
jgi:hypothetical protein